MQREGLPKYRNREQIDQQKKANKNKYINTWFLKGEHTSVLQVQASRGGRLAKKVKQVVGGLRAPDGGTTMVVEGAGQLVTSGLKKADPFKEMDCQFEHQCPMKPGQDCMAARGTYKLTCQVCGEAYYGTTGHTLHKRISEHVEALRGGNQRFSVAKHFQERHPEVGSGLDTYPVVAERVGASGIKSNLRRYVTEAIRIEEAQKGGEGLMNARGEWGRVALRRLDIATV